MWRLILILMLLLVPLAGCDDDPVTPPAFKVTVRVVDDQGDPVEGLDISLVPDTPFYQDGLKTPDYRPATVIPFQLAQASNIRLTIEDVTGSEVRLLGEQPAEAGVHHWQWNGLDDDEDSLPSGFYTAHLEVRDPSTNDLRYEERVHMLMAIISPSRYSVGTTDADGEVVLTDKRLFPHLYDAPSMPATDENGEIMGTIEFTGSMRFGLADLTGGGSMRFIRDVDAQDVLEFVWTANKADIVPAAHPDKDPIGPPVENDLGLVYPNPFN
jgi:hypothetical protein